jgi:histidinol-phosphate aminotransferase
MFRKSILKMSAYTPGEQPKPGRRLIKLNTNENPYPPPPGVRRAIIKSANEMLRLYPAPRGDAFVAQASRTYSISPQMIVAGNGSDELLAMIFRATLDAGDSVAYPVPTYSLYDTLAQVQQARVIRIAMAPDFSLPYNQLVRARAKLTIVCNPNSPSGTMTPVAELDRLAQALRGRLLLIDEAYVDFAADNALGQIRKHPNVIVTRTLSKSYSLAGMRLGLCFAQPPVIAQLLKVKDSYNLSRIAIAVGAAALRDQRAMLANIARVKRSRADAIARLRAMGFEVPQSQANFVLARILGRDMAPVVRALRARGILVRHFPTPALRDAIRISIGTATEMNALFRVLVSVLAAPARKRIVR